MIALVPFTNAPTTVLEAPNKALQTDKIAASHLLQKAQKLRHNNFAVDKRRYAHTAYGE